VDASGNIWYGPPRPTPNHNIALTLTQDGKRFNKFKLPVLTVPEVWGRHSNHLHAIDGVECLAPHGWITRTISHAIRTIVDRYLDNLSLAPELTISTHWLSGLTEACM
jgi:hypothetical protein